MRARKTVVIEHDSPHDRSRRGEGLQTKSGTERDEEAGQRHIRGRRSRYENGWKGGPGRKGSVSLNLPVHPRRPFLACNLDGCKKEGIIGKTGPSEPSLFPIPLGALADLLSTRGPYASFSVEKTSASMIDRIWLVGCLTVASPEQNVLFFSTWSDQRSMRAAEAQWPPTRQQRHPTSSTDRFRT